MKKEILLFSFLLLITSPVFAVTYNFGVKNWLSFSSELPGLTGSSSPAFGNNDAQPFIYPVPMYNVNPSVNINLSRENSIALNCMFGGAESFLLKRHASFGDAADSEGYGVTASSTDYSVVKVDSDFVFNRRVSNRMNVFAGVKYFMLYSVGEYNSEKASESISLESADGVTESVTLYDSQKHTFLQNSFGPGGGFGYNTSVADNIYLLLGISESLLNTKITQTTGRLGSNQKDYSESGGYFVISSTLKLSGAMFDAPSKVTYEAGMQYQNLFYIHYYGDHDYCNMKMLHFFGPVFNVIFSY